MGVYGIITYNNKDFKKPICHIMHIVVLLLLTLNLISKTVCHVRFRFFSVLILWLVKFGHDYETWKDSSLEQTGFILEGSFAGFPQLKKMLHKLYIGTSNGAHKHRHSILRNLQHKHLIVSIAFLFFICFSVLLHILTVASEFFFSMHIYNDDNNKNEKQRKSPFVNNKKS